MRKRKVIKFIFLIAIVGLATLSLSLLSPPSWGGKPVDGDGDGYSSRDDCDDTKQTVFPGAPELCDGIDNQCPDDAGYGEIDEGCGGGACTDDDLDGYFAESGCGTAVDCNDSNPSVNPAALEVCGDCVDNDCDNTVDYPGDEDCDGLLNEQAGITLSSNLELNDSNAIVLSDGSHYLPWVSDPAYSSFCSTNEHLCVDPSKTNYFVIIDRANPSNLALPPYSSTNPDPLGILRTFTSNICSLAEGTPVISHELIETRNTDRVITPLQTQHALRVNELLDTDLGPVGAAAVGGNLNTPIEGFGEADLYTERIKSEVYRLCTQAYTFCNKRGTDCVEASPTRCENEDGSIWVAIPLASDSELEPLNNAYEQYVTAHEALHGAGLAATNIFHVAAGWLMESSIGHSAKKDGDVITVTLHLRPPYHADSKIKYKLR